MKQETAVEWFAIQLKRIGVTEELIGHLTKEAKEMEKQQSIDAIIFYKERPHLEINAEQYYNETFS
jgi:hypothetical protein